MLCIKKIQARVWRPAPGVRGIRTPAFPGFRDHHEIISKLKRKLLEDQQHDRPALLPALHQRSVHIRERRLLTDAGGVLMLINCGVESLQLVKNVAAIRQRPASLWGTPCLEVSVR